MKARERNLRKQLRNIHTLAAGRLVAVAVGEGKRVTLQRLLGGQTWSIVLIKTKQPSMPLGHPDRLPLGNRR